MTVIHFVLVLKKDKHLTGNPVKNKLYLINLSQNLTSKDSNLLQIG